MGVVIVSVIPVADEQASASLLLRPPGDRFTSLGGTARPAVMLTQTTWSRRTILAPSCSIRGCPLRRRTVGRAEWCGLLRPDSSVAIRALLLEPALRIAQAGHCAHDVTGVRGLARPLCRDERHRNDGHDDVQHQRRRNRMRLLIVYYIGGNNHEDQTSRTKEGTGAREWRVSDRCGEQQHRVERNRVELGEQPEAAPAPDLHESSCLTHSSREQNCGSARPGLRHHIGWPNRRRGRVVCENLRRGDRLLGIGQGLFRWLTAWQGPALCGNCRRAGDSLGIGHGLFRRLIAWRGPALGGNCRRVGGSSWTRLGSLRRLIAWHGGALREGSASGRQSWNRWSLPTVLLSAPAWAPGESSSRQAYSRSQYAPAQDNV